MTDPIDPTDLVKIKKFNESIEKFYPFFCDEVKSILLKLFANFPDANPVHRAYPGNKILR